MNDSICVFGSFLGRFYDAATIFSVCLRHERENTLLTARLISVSASGNVCAEMEAAEDAGRGLHL